MRGNVLRNAQLSKQCVLFGFCGSIGGFWIECKITECKQSFFSAPLGTALDAGLEDVEWL